MDENHPPQPREDQVGFAGKILAMQPETIAHAMSHAPRAISGAVSAPFTARMMPPLLRRLLSSPQFDFQARIGLELFDDFVMAAHQVRHRHFADVDVEFPQLIQIERHKLFNLEDIDPLAKSNVGGQTLRHTEAVLQRHQHRPKTVVEIIPALLDDRFAG
jgi:hypothetical protein